LIKIENVDVFGWEAAIRGMRNPKNSWEKSDSNFSCKECDGCVWEPDTNVEDDERQRLSWCSHSPCRIGENDLKLMKTLAKAGSDHGKFLRMINVTVDITAMQPWWMEFDTYKVGTVRNSCSKMHKIHVKEFTIDDFEHSGLDEVGEYPKHVFMTVIDACNWLREFFNKTQEKRYWRALIELLPEGYKMRATVQLNYEVLRNQYYARKNHKLTEWHDYCAWVETLPYFKEICLQED
jgi:hypothetical protein